MFKRNDNHLVIDLESPGTKDDQNLLSPQWPTLMMNGDLSTQSTITSVPSGIYYPKSPTESIGNKSLR